MTEGRPSVSRVASGSTYEDSEQLDSLTVSRTDRLVVLIVVTSLFFERLDRSIYKNGGSAIPDLSFDIAVALLSLRYLHELVRGRLRLGRTMGRELVAVGFVLLVVVLGFASVATLPSWMASSSQVMKTAVHLGFLAYAALLIGRTFSRELVEFALKVYFGLASAAAVLAILQAVDLNAGNGALTRHLHLVFRPHPNGYKAPVSVFSEPAHLGYASVAALVVGLLLWRSIGLRRAIVGCTLCTLALLLALPAGPSLVAAALALIVVIQRRPKLRRRVWAGVGAAVIVLAAGALLSPVGRAMYDRARGIVVGSDPSAQYRTAVDHASVRMWKLAPASGVGLGDSRKLLPFVFHSPFRTGPLQFNDSNAYLSMLGETGVFGIAALAILIAAFGWPATRPQGRVATVTQLNTLAIAMSFFVAGAFLLPPLWFWGGLRLAQVRADGGDDLFDRVAGVVWRRIRPRAARGPSRRLPRPSLSFALLVLIVAGTASYAFGDQIASSRSLQPVTIGGLRELTDTAQPKDAALAHADMALWAARRCGSQCRASLRRVEGRVWEIDARWPSGAACFALDVSKFRKPGQATGGGLTAGFVGLSVISC